MKVKINFQKKIKIITQLSTEKYNIKLIVDAV